MRMQGTGRYRLLRAGVGALSTFALLLAAKAARADEPVRANEPHVLNEPGEVTDVIDAFDGDDPFDLHFTLGFQQTWKNAKIRRESYINNAANPGLSSGGFVNDTMNVASYTETTSRLNTRMDVGLYHDLALYFRLPIILSNNRSLDDLDGSAKAQDVVLQGAPGEGRLFSLPFKSPQRSGIEYLAVGADWGILNQFRDSSKPTWVVGVEGRFSVSEPMHACNANPTPGTRDCAYPSDIDRNGQSGGFIDSTYGSLEGNGFSGARKPGVSRGTTALEAHTLLSKRIKYVEPYGGFRALVEFQNDNSDFGGTDLKGSLVNHPPLQGWMILGVQIIPYEHREEFQRVTFDFRFQGAYRSEGRDYSELFDALGSSNAASLRSPNYASYMKNPDPATNGQYPSVVNPNSQKVWFNGITDVQAYGTFNLSTSVTWQAGEYIKFQLGVGYTREQGHFITMDQPCNPDFKNDVNASGPCRTSRSSTSGSGSSATTTTTYSATGIPNPNYRPTIDSVGRRFKVDDSNLWDAWLNAVVMF